MRNIVYNFRYCIGIVGLVIYDFYRANKNAYELKLSKIENKVQGWD